MKNLRFARLILQPSFGGLIGIFGLASIIMVGSGFSYASRNGLLYEYLFGSNSSSTFIETSRSTISLFNETVFGNPTLNKILFFVFWMLIGLVVYLILSGIGAGAGEAEQAIEESKFVNAQKGQIQSDLRFKIILRLIALGLIVLFLVLFTKILLPFGILTSRIVAGDLTVASNWFYGLLGFIVLCGSLYIALVLLRFFLLRARVFGGSEDILEDELKYGAN